MKALTRQLYQYDHLLVFSAYKTPDMHSHLASHILLATEGRLHCRINEHEVLCYGICIASDVSHTAYAEGGSMLMFLFDETSDHAKGLEDNFLKGNDFVVVEENLVEKMRQIWYEDQSDLRAVDEKILKLCGMEKEREKEYDKRVIKIFHIVHEMETIDSDVMEQICNSVFLSKSRVSHLFKENVGIPLNRYLVLEKMRKAYEYFSQSGNITEAALKAGFDSSSHYAATCKRMFGISFSDYARSTK